MIRFKELRNECHRILHDEFDKRVGTIMFRQVGGNISISLARGNVSAILKILKAFPVHRITTEGNLDSAAIAQLEAAGFRCPQENPDCQNGRWEYHV
jgi:hypothetical protein